MTTLVLAAATVTAGVVGAWVGATVLGVIARRDGVAPSRLAREVTLLRVLVAVVSVAAFIDELVLR
jgi:hypothetical protein